MLGGCLDAWRDTREMSVTLQGYALELGAQEIDREDSAAISGPLC